MIDALKDENRTMDKELGQLKEKYEGSGNQDIEDIGEKLYKLDPSAFRKTMKDLNFTGEDPEWAKREFAAT